MSVLKVLKINIYAESPQSVFIDRFQPNPSGSLYNDGLYLADDSTNPLSSTLVTKPGLVDLNYRTPVITGQRTLNESLGVDLGTPKAITELMLLDDGTAGTGINWSGSHDSALVYGSDDNLTWVKLRSYKPVDRELFSGSIYRSFFPLTSGSVISESYRYFKVYADQGTLMSGDSNSLIYTEMLTTQIPETILTSGSIYRTYYVSGLANDGGSGANKITGNIPVGGGGGIPKNS